VGAATFLAEAKDAITLFIWLNLKKEKVILW
jgi:hypothetical protein